MNKFGTSADNDFTEVTELLRIALCEKEVDEVACWRRRLFSFGVAITTTSSMSITFVVSLGNEFSGDTGPAKALFIETASNETIAIFFFILLKDIV